MTTLNASVGVAVESTYGTPTTAGIRHVPFIQDGIAPEYAVVEAADEIRAGQLASRVSQNAPYIVGASGPVEMYVPTKGFGIFLVHALGGVATVGPTDSNHTHTITPSALGLNGKSFTVQSNRPFHPGGGNQAFTFHGCKIDTFDLLMEVEGFLKATIGFDAEDVDTSTALAAVSYPTIGAGLEKFPWSLATVTINSVQVETTRFRLGINNNLKTDRRYLRGSALKKEPVRNGRIGVEWELEVDWADLTQYNRVAAATIGSRVTTIVATFDGPGPLAGATVPRLVATIHAARFDEGLPTITNDEPLMQSLSGVGLEDGTNPVVTITYRTNDATP
jgi:hypothetical protein